MFSSETLLELLSYLQNNPDATIEKAKIYYAAEENHDEQIVKELSEYLNGNNLYFALHEDIVGRLGDCPNNVLVNVYNEFADDNRYEKIYDRAEFFDIMLEGEHPEAVAEMVFYGDYRPTDKWAMFDGSGNIQTTNYPEDEVDLSEVANWILKDYTRLEKFLYTDYDYE